MSNSEKISRLDVMDSDVDVLREHYAETLKPAFVSPLSGQHSITANDLHVSMGEFDVWKGGCQSGMSVKFTEPPDLFALYAPITGSMQFRQHKRIQLSVPESMLICDFTKVDEVVLGQGRKHVGIGFSKAALIRQLSELTGSAVDSSFEFCDEFSIERDNGYLARMCSLIGESIDSDPRAELERASNKILLQAIMTRVLEIVPHKLSHLIGRPVSSAQPRHVKAAIEFMTANILTPLTLDDLAHASGVSGRSLQVAFQQFKNATPMAYMRQLRLEKARDELMSSENPNLPIGGLAKRWGFSNTGRFTTLYTASFGESPRQTRSRCLRK